jgi:hypothetical protein
LRPTPEGERGDLHLCTPLKDARLKVDGVAGALEFVPKEFKLKK